MRNRRYFTYGLAFLLGILPFFPQLSHPGSTFFYSSLLLLLFLLLCFERAVTMRLMLAFPLFLPFCAILLVSLVYTLHSVYPYQSQHKLLRLLVAMLFYLVVGLMAGRKWERGVLVWAIFCGGTVLAVHALWRQFTGYAEELDQLRQYRIYDAIMQQGIIETLEAGRALARFGNPNHLAGYLLFTSWSGVLLWTAYGRRWQRGLIGAGCLIQTACIYRTYSRSGLLALLFSVAVLGVWLLGRSDRAFRRRVLLVACVGLLILVVGLFAFGGELFGGRLLVTSTIIARVHFFRQAVSLISDRLPDGGGLESFRYLAAQYIRPGELESLYVHNLFLGAAVESGLIGVLVMLWFSIVGLRFRARPLDVRSVAGWGTFGAFLLLSCIDFQNEIAEILFVFLALQGICDGRSFPAGSEQRGGRVFPLAGVVVGGLVWWTLVFCPYMGKQRFAMAELSHLQGLDAVEAGKPSVHFFEESVHFLEKAVYWAPRDAKIANSLGKSFRMAGSEEARRVGLDFLRRAVELNPFQAYLHGDLAEALFEDGRVDEALVENEVACKIFPKKALYIRRKAKYLLALGRREEWERWTEVADRMEEQDKALRP